jgi:hypothetical protein
MLVNREYSDVVLIPLPKTSRLIVWSRSVKRRKLPFATDIDYHPNEVIRIDSIDCCARTRRRDFPRSSCLLD